MFFVIIGSGDRKRVETYELLSEAQTRASYLVYIGMTVACKNSVGAAQIIPAFGG